jgi:hypothetical protein
VVSQLGIRRKPARYPIDRSDPDNLAKQVAVTTWPVTGLDRARCEPINQQCGRVQPRAERRRRADSATRAAVMLAARTAMCLPPLRHGAHLGRI